MPVTYVDSTGDNDATSVAKPSCAVGDWIVGFVRCGSGGAARPSGFDASGDYVFTGDTWFGRKLADSSDAAGGNYSHAGDPGDIIFVAVRGSLDPISGGGSSGSGTTATANEVSSGGAGGCLITFWVSFDTTFSGSVGAGTLRENTGGSTGISTDTEAWTEEGVTAPTGTRTHTLGSSDWEAYSVFAPSAGFVSSLVGAAASDRAIDDLEEYRLESWFAPDVHTSLAGWFDDLYPPPPGGGSETPLELNASVSTTATLSRATTFVMALAASVSLSAALTQLLALVRSLSASVATSPSLVRSVGLPKLAQVLLTPTVTRGVSLTFGASIAAVASLLRSVQVSLSATATTVGTIAVSRGIVLSASVATAATMVRRVGLPLLAQVLLTPTMRRALSIALGTSVTLDAFMYRGFTMVFNAVVNLLGSILLDTPSPGGGTLGDFFRGRKRRRSFRHKI